MKLYQIGSKSDSLKRFQGKVFIWAHSKKKKKTG